MKRKLSLFLLITGMMAAWCCTSCESDSSTEPKEATLSLETPDDGTDPTRVQIGSGRYSQTFRIVTDGSWRIEKSDAGSWLTVRPESGKGNTAIALSAEANTEATARQAVLDFYLDANRVHTLTVEQASVAPYLTVEPASAALPIDGGDITLVVRTNAEGWTYSIASPGGDFLTEKSKEEGRLTLTAEMNRGSERLQATVKIAATGTPLEREVTITQGYLAADLLDLVFANDGTATDASPMRNAVQSSLGGALMTYYSDSYGRYVARFNHDPGSSPSSGYYKVDYAANTAFQQALSDGHTLEALVMFDAVADGSREIKPFSSMQAGGTGFLITNADRGRELTFLPNLAPDGWKWTRSGITPERGRYYHLVGIYDRSAQKSRIYVDGQLCREIDATGTFRFPAAGANWFCVGGDASTGTAEAAWRGDIVLARIYDEPLSEKVVGMLWDEVKERQPQGGAISLSDLFFLPKAGVRAGSVYKVFGTGFLTGDRMRLESTVDRTVSFLCDATATDSSLAFVIPDAFVSGTYRMVLCRGEALYPVGMVELTLTDNPTSLNKLPQVIAHRGFHTTNGAAENSLASFAAAIDLDIYGSEADFYITTDGVVVSNHDPTIDGIRIEEASYDRIKDIRLSNGETVATLQTYLDRLGDSPMKLVVEIKQHNTTTNNERVVDAVVEMLAQRRMTDRCDFISFGYDICRRLASKTENALIGYLSGDKAPAALDPGIKCIDYQMNVLKNNPQWIAEAHERGMKVNVWTVNSEADMMDFIVLGVDFITTDHPDRLKAILDRLAE